MSRHLHSALGGKLGNEDSGSIPLEDKLDMLIIRDIPEKDPEGGLRSGNLLQQLQAIATATSGSSFLLRFLQPKST